MIKKLFALALLSFAVPIFAKTSDNVQLKREIRQLQHQTKALQHQLAHMQKQMHRPVPAAKHQTLPPGSTSQERLMRRQPHFRSRIVSIHVPDEDEIPPDRYFPTALIADDKIITYIAGTPVVTSPYTGDRPAFDGSDHIVNISSINRDIRLMQQRRRVYNAYEALGYGIPKVPIIALSGKLEPYAKYMWPYFGPTKGDISLGSSELDVAAAMNHYIEGFFSIVYDENPPIFNRQRVLNSALSLNMGFINIGDLDQTPFYFTAGQVFAPFGRFSSSMVSSPLPLVMARTKTRPVIFGYKSQGDYGPYAAVYAFATDTTNGREGVGGYNLGYVIQSWGVTGDIGVGYIGSLNDSHGMQITGSRPGTTFGGFGSPTNGNENVAQIPGVDIHGNISFSRYSLTAEWVTASRRFREMDLSFNGRGARPSAGQLEAGVTFMAFGKPASLAAGYQWAHDTLALNIPEQRICAVFNMSIWRDTVESLEYRHDIDYSSNSYANGASAPNFPPNLNTLGTGRAADTIVAQIGLYF